jgi:hypothetical protein
MDVERSRIRPLHFPFCPSPQTTRGRTARPYPQADYGFIPGDTAVQKHGIFMENGLKDTRLLFEGMETSQMPDLIAANSAQIP